MAEQKKWQLRSHVSHAQTGNQEQPQTSLWFFSPGGDFVTDTEVLAILNQLEADLRAANEALAFVLKETSTGYCRECGSLTFFEKDGEMQHTPDCPTLAIHRQRVGEEG